MDSAVTVASLHVHPVKSCAGLRVDAALLADTGLAWDRQWMVVDAAGHFVSQRQHPRMALVQPRLGDAGMALHAPGMPPLALPLQATAGPRCRVQVWDDTVSACDLGAPAALWFSDFLAVPGLRLVRFDPAQRRLSSARWCQGIEAANAFSDGYPLLVASTASLAELNRRLALHGQPPVGIERFRPNLVLDGLDAHGEDFLDTLHFPTPEGEVVLKLVKPCTRCSIPSVDPATGVQGHEPGDTLAGYRADPRMNGGITFAMNAVIVEGIGRTLRVGQRGGAVIAF